MNLTSNPLFFLIRRYVYQALGALDRLLGRQPQFALYCYHSIATDGWRFSVKPEEFKKQMYHLLTHYAFLTTTEMVELHRKGKSIPKTFFGITFDDGYKNIYTMRNFLKAQKIKPTVFVLANKRQANKETLGTQLQLLTNHQIKELKKSGWEIGCHGATHTILPALDRRVLKKEIIRAKEKLEQTFSGTIKGFSYPKGKYSPAVLETVQKAGYDYAVSMDDRVLIPSASLLTIPRVGVDGSHTFEEFKVLASPSVIALRRFIRSIPLGYYL